MVITEHRIGKEVERSGRQLILDSIDNCLERLRKAAKKKIVSTEGIWSKTQKLQVLNKIMYKIICGLAVYRTWYLEKSTDSHRC
jgi:hypothetical protein